MLIRDAEALTQATSSNAPKCVAITGVAVATTVPSISTCL